MLEKLGKDSEKDIDTIFNDFDLLRATSKEVLTKLTNIAKVGSVFWLSDVYVSSKSYMNAHQTFYRGHAAGLTRFINLREKSPVFRQALSSCYSHRFRDATLMDLFYYISNRFTYIYDLAQSQYNALKAFNDLGKSIRASTQLHIEVLRSLPPHQHAQQQARCGKDSMISGMLLAEAQNALDRLKEVESSASSANAIHEVAHLVRSIKQPSGSVIPDAPGRALLGTFDISLRNRCPFGLSTEVPALLMVFNDGVALCTRLYDNHHVRSNSINSPRSRKSGSAAIKVSEYKYRLLDWYQPDELWVTRLRHPDADTENVLRFAKNRQPAQCTVFSSPSQSPVMSPRSSPKSTPQPDEAVVVLPPGWEDVPKGKKHSYTYKPCGIAQGVPPEAPPQRAAVHDIVFAAGGKCGECVKMLGQCTGKEDCVHEEVCRSPYKMFGSPLEGIMAYEQKFSPHETTPHIVNVLSHALISRGVAEDGLLKSTVEDAKRATELAQAIDEGRWAAVKWGELEPQVLAALMKKFIRDLSDGVIPGDVYDKFLDIGYGDDMLKLRKLLKGLPKSSYFLLKDSLFALDQVASNAHVNNMDAPALAEVAAPSIMARKDGNFNVKDCEKANRVTEIMIENYHTLFNSPFSPYYSEPQAAASSDRPENSWVTFCRKLVGHKKSIKVFTCLPDERSVLTIDGGGVGMIWDTTERLYVKSVDFAAHYPAAFAFGPDATTLWIGCADAVLVYDIETFALRATIPIGGFSLLRVGNTIWCGGEGVIKVVVAAGSSSKYNVVAEIRMSAPIIVSSMVEVPTEDAVWVSGHCKGADNSIYVVNKESLAEIISFQAHSQKINALAMCRGNVWSCSDDSTIRVWNTRNFRLIEKLCHHSGAVYGLCALSDQVWSCSWDKTMCVWDIDSLSYLGVINGYHTDSVMGMIRVGSKRDIWSQSVDKSICVWEVKRLNK